MPPEVSWQLFCEVYVKKVFVRNIFSKERVENIRINNDRLAKRRTVSIVLEWVMFSFIWNMFYFQYFKGHLNGFSNLFAANAATIGIVLIIFIGFDLFAEYLLLRLSAGFVDFVLTGEYWSLEDISGTEDTKRPQNKKRDRKRKK